LNCIKIRYTEHLSFSVDLPSEMKAILVPKRIVQPIVENAIKHGLNIAPPWTISVSGRIEQDRWYVTVTDNGAGCDPEILTQLDHFIQTTNDLTHLPELAIDGMGLKNIFIRLKFMYQENAYFRIENRPERGVSVTIGGTIHSRGRNDGV